MKPRSILAVFFWVAISAAIFAQNSPVPATAALPPAATAPATDHGYKPMTLKLNDDGSKYIRFITWLQFWGTSTENNPGTKDVNGKPIDGSEGADQSWSSDFALRRARFLVYAQISPRFDPYSLGHQQPKFSQWRRQCRIESDRQRRQQRRQTTTVVHSRCLDGIPGCQG